MIYVSEKQLHQVEYLLKQSMLGNHVLFAADEIRGALSPEFSAASPKSDDAAYEVEHHVERLITQPTLSEQRAYLDKLDVETFRRVVRTYINIVENNLYESTEVRH